LPPEIIHKYRDALNPSKERMKVVDKIKFTRIMNEHDIPVVQCLFKISRNGIILDKDDNEVTFEMFCNVLMDFGVDEYFIKPYNGGSGAGIEKLYIKDKSLILRDKKLVKDTIFDELFSRSRFDAFIVQPKILQHHLLSEINSSCVNTVRIDTLILDDQVINNAAFLRVGDGNSFIDNLSTGGFNIGIDIDTGELMAFGKTEAKFGRKCIYSHPMSGVTFKGLKLPFWKELKIMVNGAALKLQPLKYLGWDIAIENDGPIIIEANQDFAADSIQEAAGGIRKTKVGREIIKELDIP